MRSHSFILLIFLFLILFPPLNATIIHVPDDYATIQGGINDAVNGDTVMVDPGTYYEYDIDFLGKAITVMGTDPEDSAVVAATIVDADSMSRVFHFHSGEDSTSLLTGLTITGGYAENGGGIYCDTSSPTISYNIITGNSVYEYPGGGGLYCNFSDSEIEHNIISNNYATWRGGGVYSYYSESRIHNNTIRGNHVGDYGGGICCLFSDLRIASNIIKDNIVDYGDGGGILVWGSTPTISNNVISGNEASYGGGISCFLGATPIITNNSIVENSASGGGGISCTRSSTTVVTNTILWDNTAVSGKEIYIGTEMEPSTVIISYSDVDDWPYSVFVDTDCILDTGEGMIDSEPLFEDALYHLESSSFCVDAGDPAILDACRPPGLGEERSDIGAYGGEENCQWLEGLADLVLMPRDSTIVEKGDTLFFDTLIWNSSENIVSGDYWLSIVLPSSNEILIPEAFLNYSNPLSGNVPSHGSLRLDNELYIPMNVPAGSYRLIGRIGRHPGTVFDEESFGIQVIE